ncbi:hypothetical protein [[Mycobacterium] wendilense]|uniref:Uncharacterized protein n=1 Tax=[Mycobacterium] wendilense TaxID=3064284 RepID=A0ABN9PBX0_9MYCO|nr:hypothetical protein [Mycolicibacterium sp. MU0050]CAJ1586990.1 hypothetical protein MU0050_004556 [Mycolicibacterium sp. MU0050]
MRRHLADRMLRAAIRRAGAPGSLRFTERQLFYEMCRGLLPAHRLPRRPGFTTPTALPYRTFRSALERHGPIDGLLATPAPAPSVLGRHTPEPDLFDYGLPRMLVCQTHAVAVMLRANGIPMESACPVLSVDELPADPRLARMLYQAGTATVYVLHDAGPAGLAAPRDLRRLTEVPPTAKVVPIGLRPAQAWPLHLAHVPGPATPSEAALSGKEQAWLRRGRTVEVEAVPPAVLLRSVHRLVRGVARADTGLVNVQRARRAGFLTWPTG